MKCPKCGEEIQFQIPLTEEDKKWLLERYRRLYGQSEDRKKPVRWWSLPSIKSFVKKAIYKK